MSDSPHPMVLENLAIPTDVVRPNTPMRAFIAECVRCKVPGLPYVNAAGEIVGRLSLRHAFKTGCIPFYLVDAAQVLGDGAAEIAIPESRIKAFLDEPVERYLLKPLAHTSSRSPMIKALAIMEKFNSGYIFLIDDGVYKGVVTHLEIAQRLMEHARFGSEAQA